ncbi:MAG: sigma-70 family RNA polymerase sigma factor [Deltaproteobacteria bacterium]|nr:sigma-70 family RNA polymerase sigma factor [Deltaproteobacteria bacterium]MBK8239689.1 sigma-70 family RNA polymerase sigma factor [Deltaproteobacteria bacterium]MBK8714429.1 sigma-70 family RNA polymerase sigma factor [Deltaproteobacteria bacterium]MBP7290745.1 sigma-70 family RNA polymerase sigma factor [Nannocystaceae bacterium]
MPDFEHFYREHVAFVWAAARRFGVEPALLDDVVQEVFLTAHRRRHELDWESSPRGWLWAVTRRVAFRHRRTAARTARRHELLRSHAAQPHEPQRDHDAARALERMLAGLESTQRETFVMSELLGMSGPEIAARHRVSVNTVYSRLRLARTALERAASDELPRMVASARAHDRPGDADERRMWAAMAPMLGHAAVAAGTGVGAGTSWLIAAVAAAAAIAIGLHAPSGRDAATTPAEAVLPLAPALDPTAPEPATLPRVMPPPPEPSATPQAAVRPTPRPREPQRAAAIEAATAAAAQDQPPEPAHDLAAELALIDEATAALARSDPEAALAALDRHRSAFRHGQLADVRDSTLVAALCAAGRTEDARAQDQRLRRGSSSVATARRAPCW